MDRTDTRGHADYTMALLWEALPAPVRSALFPGAEAQQRKTPHEVKGRDAELKPNSVSTFWPPGQPGQPGFVYKWLVAHTNPRWAPPLSSAEDGLGTGSWAPRASVRRPQITSSGLRRDRHSPHCSWCAGQWPELLAQEPGPYPEIPASTSWAKGISQIGIRNQQGMKGQTEGWGSHAGPDGGDGEDGAGGGRARSGSREGQTRQWPPRRESPAKNTSCSNPAFPLCPPELPRGLQAPGALAGLTACLKASPCAQPVTPLLPPLNTSRLPSTDTAPTNVRPAWRHKQPTASAQGKGPQHTPDLLGLVPSLQKVTIGSGDLAQRHQACLANSRFDHQYQEKKKATMDPHPIATESVSQ